MDAVDVLAVVDGVDHVLLVDVLGQRQLHDKAVHIIVLIQLLDAGQQLFLGRVLFHADE